MTSIHENSPYRKYNISNDFFDSRRYRSSLALGVLAAAITADNRLACMEKYNSSKEAGLVSYESDAESTLITLPGCRTDGECLAEMMHDQVSDVGDSHFLVYPERGFSLESIKEKLLVARDKSGDKPLNIYAISMGGMVLAEALKDEEFKNKLGKIDKLILDSCPSDETNTRKQAKFAMGAAALLQNSWFMSNVTGWFSYIKSIKNLGHDDLVSDSQVDEHFHSTSFTPLHRTASQADFMKQTNIPHRALSGCINEIYYIQSSYDRVVDTEEACKEYSGIYNQRVLRVIDEHRSFGSHAAGPEYQQSIVDILKRGHDSEIAKNGDYEYNYDDFDYSLYGLTAAA